MSTKAAQRAAELSRLLGTQRRMATGNSTADESKTRWILGKLAEDGNGDDGTAEGGDGVAHRPVV
jgi:hypothetical protein